MQKMAKFSAPQPVKSILSSILSCDHKKNVKHHRECYVFSTLFAKIDAKIAKFSAPQPVKSILSPIFVTSLFGPNPRVKTADYGGRNGRYRTPPPIRHPKIEMTPPCPSQAKMQNTIENAMISPHFCEK